MQKKNTSNNMPCLLVSGKRDSGEWETLRMLEHQEQEEDAWP